MKMGKRLQINWRDAWIDNEILQEDFNHLKDPKTVCTIVGFLVFKNDNTIGIAAEKVIGREGDISWRAVTFIPKCLIIDIKEI